MGFNMTGAVAGLLGEYGNQANQMVARRQEIEQRKLEQAIADRKELALLTRQERLEALAYYKEEQKNLRDEANRKADIEKEDLKWTKRSELEDKKNEQREARYAAALKGGGGGSDKPSAFAEKVAYADQMVKAGKWSAEKADSFIGAGDGESGKKGGLTENQIATFEGKLAEIVVEDDTTMKQYNAIAKHIGMPLMKKVEKDPGRKGILGIGSKEPVIEYVEDWEGMSEKEDVSAKPESPKSETKGEAQAAPAPKGNIKDTAMELLRKGQKGKADAPPESGILATPKEPASTDIGSVLGTIVNGGVTAVKKIAAGGQDLKELEGQFLDQLANAREQEKSAILKAIAAVRQVMMTETNPETELRSRAIAPR